MRIMIIILVVYMKQDQAFVEIIHQHRVRMKSAMQIEDNARVMIPANNQIQEIVANAPTPDL